ncbi:MAG: S8 family serine peptidase [Oligoflexia bacterium]|nr:S8 family serine peptidase [Oligoflexia bacterium]
MSMLRIFLFFLSLILAFNFLNVYANNQDNDKNKQVKDEYIIRIKVNDNKDRNNGNNSNHHQSSLINVTNFFNSKNNNKNFANQTSKRKILHKYKLQSLNNLIHVQLAENDLIELKKQLKDDIDFIEPNYLISISNEANREKNQKIDYHEESEENLLPDEDLLPIEQCNGDANAGSNINIGAQKWNEFVESLEDSVVATPVIPADQWSLKNSNNIDLSALNAWKITTGNKNIVVAIIDSGMDYNHKALKHATWINKGEIANNGIDDDNNGYVDDVIGWNFVSKTNNPKDESAHGTHCAGIIAAKSSVAMGIAPDVSIMPLKFIDKSGFGSLSNSISAIEYAIQMKVNIISASWGNAGYSHSLRDVIEAAKNAKILFVTAAGNEKTDIDKGKFYPASYTLDNIITVASINRLGGLSSFSNYGAVTVDIAAPGSYILSSIPGNEYSYFSGTSMASPYVAGVAALLLSARPDLSLIAVKEAILKSAVKIDSLKNKVATAGFVNAYKTLTYFDSSSPSVPVIEVPGDDTPPLYFDFSKVKLNVLKKKLLIKLKRVTLTMAGDENQLRKIKQVTYAVNNTCRKPKKVTSFESNFLYKFLTYKDKQTITYTLKIDNGEEFTFTENI